MRAAPPDAARLLDLPFLEEQARTGALPELLDAFEQVLANMDHDVARRLTFTLLARAIRVDLAFLTRRPTALFQCLYNRGFWCAAVETAPFFKSAPEANLDAPLQPLLADWLARSLSPHPWLRSLRPPAQLLEGPLREEYRGDFSPVALGFDDDDRAVWIGLLEGPERIYCTNAWSRRTGLPIAATQRDYPRKEASSRDSADTEPGSGGQPLVRAAGTAATLQDLRDDQASNITAIACSPDGRLIAVTGTGDEDSYDFFNLYDAATGSLIHETRKSSQYLALKWSADSRRLAATTHAQVHLFHGETGALLSILNTAVTHVAFSSSGGSLATAAKDVVRIWDLGPAPLGRSGLFTTRLRRDQYPFTTGGKRLVDGVRLCDAESGAPIARIDLDTSGYLEGGPPEGALFLGANRIVSLSCGFEAWDTTTGHQLEGEAGRHYAQWHTIAFSPDGLRYAVTRDRYEAGGLVAVRDVDRGTLLASLNAPRATCLAFSPDGATIATGSSDHGVHLWNAVTGQLTTTCSGHAAPLTAVAFSSDGRCLVSAGDDEALSLWDAVSGEQLATRPLDDSDPGELGYVLGVTKYRRRFEATVAELRRIDGWAGFTADVRPGPFVAKQGAGELTLVRRETGEAIAWLPGSEAVHAHPSGRIWAGSGHHFQLEEMGTDGATVVRQSYRGVTTSGRPPSSGPTA